MSDDADAHWIRRAERAIAGGESADCEVLRGRRPPLLDRFGASALVSPVLAAFLWGAVAFREVVEPSPIDPWTTLLRLLAVGLTVRTVLLYAELVRRFQVALAANRSALALTPEGLFLRTGAADFLLPREHIVAVTEHGDWRARHGRSYRDVYVVMRPESGRAWVAIPPVFDDTPSLLAARLSEWLGKVDGPADFVAPDPGDAPAAVYDAAANGTLSAGSMAIRHGRGWIKRGPYATLLFGITILIGFVRLPSDAWTVLGPLAIGALVVSFVLVPLAWLWMTNREIRPLKKLAIVLTPAEAIMRVPRGMLRVRWSVLRRAFIESRRTWSILEGYHEARTLVLERGDGPAVRYDEAFLGAPCEVVVALADAYRRGVIGASPAPDSVA